jgi:hypothetical protein
MTRTARFAYFLAPMLVCAAVYWRAPFIWFRIDDFAWLGLPQYARQFGISHALFDPQAQGTVRVLSERVFFLVLSALFGLHAWPFRAISLVTWFADLVLIQLIGSRLTGSRVAGLWAAVLWTMSATLILPLAWASAYNEVLCAFLMMTAFYARLRWIESGAGKWRWIEAGAYLLGFGALEVIVVYPVLVLVYSAVSAKVNALARRRQPGVWSSMWWMFLPAAAFGLAHLRLMSAETSPIYRLYFDRRLITDLFAYVLWTVGPSRMELVGEAWRQPGVVASKVIALVLAGFALWKIWRREFAALFMGAWFVIVLAPVLPLANHLSEYYVTVPGIGLGWLAGWAMVSAWRSGVLARTVVVLIAGAYAAGSIAEIDRIAAWQMDVTARMRVLLRALEGTTAEYPGTALVLTGVSEDLFLAGFRDDPFRLLGIHEVWLAPGQDQVLYRKDLDGLDRFRTSMEELAPRMAGGGVRVLELAGATVHDVTGPYSAVMRALYADTHPNFVDAGDPSYSVALGSGWYPIENSARWIGRTATLDIRRAADSQSRLYVTGFAAKAAVEAGPVPLRFLADGHEIGTAKIAQPGPFNVDFAMPPGPAVARITIECNRVMRPPGDPRELGMILRTFTVR